MRQLLGIAILLLLGCSGGSSDDDSTVEEINLISLKIDGANLTDGLESVSTNPSIRFSFNKSVSASSFQNALKINSTSSHTIVGYDYLNNSAIVEVEFDLDFDSSYTITLSGAIGTNGEVLSSAINTSFSTMVDDKIYSLPPCTNTADCKRTTDISHSSGTGSFDFYSNYPIFEENAEWQNLEKAVVVIHGGSYDADNYFNHLTSSLESLNVSSKTVLISPHFKRSQDNSNDLFWTSPTYRDGQNSSGPASISSFEVLDILISRLANKTYFPVLNEIIITGQSSGGRYVHTYSAGNKSESAYDSINFEYIVSESQFFYYTTSERINEQTGNLYSPGNCPSLSIWPFGYTSVPTYVSSLSKETFDNRFINRSITYLLGNGTGTDSSLVTTQCASNLLGSSRYQRGENIFKYMGLKHSGHNHKKVIVPNVTHDGEKIYKSSEFKNLLTTLFNN